MEPETPDSQRKVVSTNQETHTGLLFLSDLIRKKNVLQSSLKIIPHFKDNYSAWRAFKLMLIGPFHRKQGYLNIFKIILLVNSLAFVFHVYPRQSLPLLFNIKTF